MHTPGPWDTVGATRIWGTNAAVCIVAEPECNTSNDFHEVRFGSKRWREAMSNAEFIVRACNAHDDLLEACKAARTWVALATGRDPVTTHPDAIANAKADLAMLDSAIAKATT